MVCSNCQTLNVDDANFCLNCGYRVSILCTRCSRRVTSFANFCDGCGFQLDLQDQPEVTRPEDRPLVKAKEKPVQPATAQAFPSPDTANTQVIQPAADAVADYAGLIEKEAPAPAAAAVDSSLAQYIPDELMKKLDAARSSGDMVGERRVVTMLFCDIRGSTAAAENLDPEDWSEIINGAFEHMIKPVYTYEGTVARLMGDGILAFFGAPLAHEDDPQRAVLAGLDMIADITPYREKTKQAWGFDINLRVGINTGLVVVGSVGSDLRMEYTAMGDAINMAARMEQTAEPGTVQISEDTYRLVKPLFTFQELEGIKVKGKEGLITAYRVLERKSSVGRVRGIEGLQADLVGREVELQTLSNVVADLKQGVGRIVCLLGEAGLGKSRLITETRANYEEMPGIETQWFETTSLSYETNQAYGLFQRLIRRMSGIGYDDAPRMMQKKLAVLAEALPEEKRPRATQLFEALFGLNKSNNGPPLEGETFKRELLDAICDLWRVQFSERPTVIVFDDMHWSDAASIELLKELLPLTAEIGLVLICAMRDERQAPAWQIKNTADDQYHHHYTEISLGPLSQSESNELVNRLLQVPEIPGPLRSSILEKSDGNPFFIEEVVRALIDNSVVIPEERMVDGKAVGYWVATGDGSDFSIPDNLQSLLAARMDRLEEATRATLQLASVIGRSFYLRVLQAVDQSSPELDKHVGTLLRLDMIRESARVPEVEYSFRNPLTQEAVYKTILLKRRRQFHLRVGQAMEDLYSDHQEGLHDLLAHHYTLANEKGEAIKHSRMAAKQAVGVYAYEEAAQNLRAALELIAPEDQSKTHMELLEELGDVCSLIRDFFQAVTFFKNALAIWESLPDVDRTIALRLNRKIVDIANDTKWSVDAETYQEISEISQDSKLNLQDSLITLADEPGHSETVHVLVSLSTEAWRVQTPSDWESAQAYAQDAVIMAEKLDDAILLSQSLGVLANVLDGRSLLRQHVNVAQRRLELTEAEDFEDIREKIDSQRGIGVALMYVGQYDEALPYLERAAVSAANIVAADQVANALGIKAQCLFRMDRWDDVLETEKQWRELENSYTRERIGETCFFVALSASVLALRGDLETAGEYAKESYDYMVSMSGLPDEWQRNQFY